MDLHQKISDIITNELFERFESPSSAVIGVALTDRILAIPEIKEALAYMAAVDSAHPVFGEIREMLNRETPTP